MWWVLGRSLSLLKSCHLSEWRFWWDGGDLHSSKNTTQNKNPMIYAHRAHVLKRKIQGWRESGPVPYLWCHFKSDKSLALTDQSQISPRMFLVSSTFQLIFILKYMQIYLISIRNGSKPHNSTKSREILDKKLWNYSFCMHTHFSNHLSSLCRITKINECQQRFNYHFSLYCSIMTQALF